MSNFNKFTSNYNYNNPQAQAYGTFSKKLEDSKKANAAEGTEPEYNPMSQDNEEDSGQITSEEIFKNAGLDPEMMDLGDIPNTDGAEPSQINEKPDQFVPAKNAKKTDPKVEKQNKADEKKLFVENKKILKQHYNDTKDLLNKGSLTPDKQSEFKNDLNKIKKDLDRSDELKDLSKIKEKLGLLSTEIDTYQKGTGHDLETFKKNISDYLLQILEPMDIPESLKTQMKSDIEHIQAEADLHPENLSELNLKLEKIKLQISEAPKPSEALQGKESVLAKMDKLVEVMAGTDEAKKSELLNKLYNNDELIAELDNADIKGWGPRTAEFISKNDPKIKQYLADPAMKLPEGKTYAESGYWESNQEHLIKKSQIRDRVGEIMTALGYKVTLPEHGFNTVTTETIVNDKNNPYSGSHTVTHDRDYKVSDEIGIEIGGKVQYFDLLKYDSHLKTFTIVFNISSAPSSSGSNEVTSYEY